LLKASPAAAGKPVYVNVFSPFTVAMQCDPRLLERLQCDAERPLVSKGLHAIAAATSEYISSLAAAGADGIFYSNKFLRSELGSLVDEWVLPFDAEALAPLRTTEEACRVCLGEEEGNAPDVHLARLDTVLHACGANIAYERILAAFDGNAVYPKDTALSWNFEQGNPSVEYVLKTTSLRVWGTYSRFLLREAADAEASDALQSYLLQHKAWLEEKGFANRVVVGPDCCPGAFVGEEVPVAGWDAVHHAYSRFVGRTEDSELVRLPVLLGQLASDSFVGAKNGTKPFAIEHV